MAASSRSSEMDWSSMNLNESYSLDHPAEDNMSVSLRNIPIRHHIDEVNRLLQEYRNNSNAETANHYNDYSNYAKLKIQQLVDCTMPS